MNRPPFGHPADGSGVDSALAQQFGVRVPAAESRATEDLDWREVRDSLWLAKSLAPPVDRTPPEVSAAPPPVGTPDPLPAATVEDNPEAPTDALDPGPRPEPNPEPSSIGAVGRDETWSVSATGSVRTSWAPADGREQAPLAWPTVPALPDSALIAKALRPFNRPTPSPWRQVLDEDATAERVAQDRLWLPEWRPAPWHRFEVLLVIDTSVSMEVWEQTVHEFRAVLERQGAFRSIRVCLVDCDHVDQGKLALRMEGPGEVQRGWRDLVDTTGRRIVLMITDTVGAAWRAGTIQRVLAHWAGAMPCAVVNVLPQDLWHWGALSPRRVKLTSGLPGLANASLQVGTPSRGRPADGVVLPVLGLDPQWLSGWAKLVTGTRFTAVETTAVMVSDRDHEAEFMPLEEPEPLTARGRVLKFRTVASVQAFQLAGLLAAAPLNIPMMKLVQRVVLPGSRIATLAEVLLGGLLHRTPEDDPTPDPTSVVYEFYDGVREELLSGGRRDDTVRVARIVSGHGSGISTLLKNFREALDSPESTEYPEISERSAPHLRVQAAVLRALSGRYSRRGGQLRRKLALAKQQVDAVEGRPSANDNVTPADAPALPSGAGSTRWPAEEDPVTTTDLPPKHGADDAQAPLGGDEVTTSGPISVESRRGPASLPQVWGSVPLRNPDFVGRSGLLEQLKQRLMTPGATAVLPEALHGMGGVGKSQTVVEYIYQHAAEYEMVWWISAEHPAQIRSRFVDLATRLGMPAAASADTAVPMVLEALRKGEPFGRWLLVFDNADAPDEVRPFFPSGSGHVIVTSRNAEWAGVARTVEVDLFSRDESKELLSRRGGTITDAEADQLADALGDLPLAIEQAAAWRAQTGMPVSEYVQLLEQNRNELLALGVPTDYQVGVAAAWNVPLARLRDDHPAALEMLQLCAFFGPEPISRNLFNGGRDAPVPDALREALGDPIKLSSAIREISRYSLAKIDNRNNTLQLHRLVQAVLKGQLNDADHEGMRHAVHRLLVNGDPGDPEDSAGWPRYAALLPHAITSRALVCQDRWVRGMIINLVRYLLSAGDYAGANDFAGQVLETWRSTLGERDRDTLTMARHFGISLRRLGRTDEASALNQRTYDLLKEEVEENDVSLLSMGDSVAADFRSKGEFASELRMQQEVYERAQHALPEDDPDLLQYASNLAGCLRLVGDFFSARDLDVKTVRSRTFALGENHRATFVSLNALAMDLRECGLYVEAAASQEEALVRQRAVLGDDHPITVGAIRSLAVAKRKAGDHERARELAEDCLDRCRRRYGDRHIDTVTALMGLAADLRHVPDLVESRRLGEQSYSLFASIRGEHHPFTLIAATNLAVTLRLMGEVEEARALNESSLATLEESLGADHSFSLVAAANLASDLAELGELDAAHALDVGTLEKAGRTLGSEHPTTLAVALNLSLDLGQMGRSDESAILHTNTTSAFRKVLGAEHPATKVAEQMIRANCDTDTMQT